MKDLGNRSMSAVFWGGGGSIVRIVLQFATQVVLARLLGPEQYGLFAIGAIVISFSNFFSDIGIAYGLIQKKELHNEDLRFVFTWQLIIGLGVTLAVAVLSDPIATFFGDEAARGVVAALSVVCLLNALTAPSLNLLKRELDFKRMQIAQVIAYVVGYIVIGLPLALAGAQVWALVVAWIVQSLVTLVILYTGSRHPVRPLFWYGDARQLAGYGFMVLVTNIINWVIGTIDRVVIGKVFAARDIGLYATAYNIVQSPTASLLGIVQPVFFSASSRLSDTPLRIEEGYRALVGAIAIFVVPVFACVAVIPDTFVLALYGGKWADAAVVLQPLALAMPLYLLWGMTTPLLWTGGTPEREFKTQLPVAILWVGGSWLAAQHSVAAVAWMVCALFGLRCVVILVAACRTLSMRLSPLWRAARGGVFIAIVCAMAVAAMDHGLSAAAVRPLVRLLCEVGVSAVLYIALLTCVPGLVGADCLELLQRLANRCPAPVARWLRALTSADAADVPV